MEQKNRFYLTISGVDYEIHPHYKELKKEYKKENNQFFFREVLDGKITLWDNDYFLVKNTSLNDTILFKVIRNGSLYAKAEFNKSDCVFDHFKLNVELNLQYGDKYSKVVDAYENTYDLIKLAPAITPLTLTKRGIVQIYIQGENVVSNYSGGTYWETEVSEQIDNEDELERKYYFSKGPKFIEVDLQGFSRNINAVYTGDWSSNIWNAISTNGNPCSIVFSKIANANDICTHRDVKYMSTGDGDARKIGNAVYYKFDTYKIQIYDGKDGTGTLIYESQYYYGKDTDNFTIAVGTELYPMVKSESIQATPETFYLGEQTVEYQVWGRLLCDVDVAKDGTTLCDVPYDDFATPCERG